MGKNDANKQNRTLLDTARTQNQQVMNPYMQQATKDLSTARDQSNELRGQIINAYNTLPGAGGGAASVDFNSIGDYANARNVYQRFADTGGLTDSDISNLRYRATSTIPSFYENYKNTLARRANVQGGYSPGYDAQMAAIGRDSARQAYEASRDAEAGITTLRNQGQLQGAGGLMNIGNAALGAATTNAQLQNDAMSRNAQLQAARASGLASLYSATPGGYNSAMENYLRGAGQLSDADLQALGLRSNIRDRSWLDAIPGMVGAGAAVASAYSPGGYRY